ncbi:MAG: hypothetical protein IPK59_20010 [Rhodospirillaceae bacterium]|nr:hypothetical protein [Rhodospirillaceae bacterium]
MQHRLGRNLVRTCIGALVGVGIALSLNAPALADSNIKGKKVIFVPISWVSRSRKAGRDG